jgi:CDP-paratose 2-epimerase
MNRRKMRAGRNGYTNRVKSAENEISIAPPGRGVPAEPPIRPVLITGGAGFIGTNVAHRYLSVGEPVLIFDNLSRPGVERNLEWLRKTHGNRVQVQIADVRDAAALRIAAKRASKVFHLAAQVAVTTSLDDPCHDFEVNARGTLNLLEAIRAVNDPPPLIFTSTNKVYGEMQDVSFQRNQERYEPEDQAIARNGFGEDRYLHFNSPYGCSKGAADQYVLDYARTFKLPAVVFRMSCIYGWHQFGNEDQGWVAHFLIRALQNQPLTIYGDGRQVRDILFIEDLVDAFEIAHEEMESLQGNVFNIGGGPQNTTSLLELMELIREMQGRAPNTRFADWRPADQLYYVSDIRKFSEATDWRPRTNVQQGIAKLFDWLRGPEFAKAAPRVFMAQTRNGNGNGHTCRNGNASRGEKITPLYSVIGRTRRRSKIARLAPTA